MDLPPTAADVAPASALPTQISKNASFPGQAHLARIVSSGSENLDANNSWEEGAGSPPSKVDLALLKAEKATLHQTLQSYEKDFFRLHNRQVSRVSIAGIRKSRR